MQLGRSGAGLLTWEIRCDRCRRGIFGAPRCGASTAIDAARTKGWAVSDNDVCPYCITELRRLQLQ